MNDHSKPRDLNNFASVIELRNFANWLAEFGKTCRLGSYVFLQRKVKMPKKYIENLISYTMFTAFI